MWNWFLTFWVKLINFYAYKILFKSWKTKNAIVLGILKFACNYKLHNDGPHLINNRVVYNGFLCCPTNIRNCVPKKVNLLSFAINCISINYYWPLDNDTSLLYKYRSGTFFFFLLIHEINKFALITTALSNANYFFSLLILLYYTPAVIN